VSELDGKKEILSLILTIKLIQTIDTKAKLSGTGGTVLELLK